MKDKILKEAKEAFKKRLKNNSNVSENTLNAQQIARDWRLRCWKLDPDRILIEATVHPGLNQRIDVVDRQDHCAYEFKVSGKNATSEFYKDVVKVILWNEERPDKLEKLIFITEEEWGKRYLNTEMPKAFMAYLSRSGLKIDIEYIRHG